VRRVLIAEDDVDTAAAIKTTLEESLPVVVDLVTNGALVLDQLVATRPDLIILDVTLPGLNGIDVFDLVRGSDKWDGPVLFLTASPDRARRAFARNGVREIMRKPFEARTLVSRVSRLLERSEKVAS
jgi:two-component system response regulator RstA